MSAVAVGQDALKEVAFDVGVREVTVTSLAAAPIAQNPTRVVRMIAQSGVVNAHPVEFHLQGGGEKIIISLRRVDAMRRCFAKDFEPLCFGELGVSQRDHPLEKTVSHTIAPIERAFFIPLAAACRPFRSGPIGWITAQNQRTASLFEWRRITIPYEEVNEVARDDQAIRAAGFDQQITKHWSVRQFQF